MSVDYEGVPFAYPASSGALGAAQAAVGWGGQQAVVTLPSADGTARELMDAVLVAADRQTGWSLAWRPGPENGGTGGWAFTFTVAGPDKELELNGTPLTTPR